MIVHIGSDHAGFDMKQELISFLQSKEISVHDHGTYGSDSVDYPDFAHAVAEAVVDDEASLGLLLCGSANGVAMAANKHTDIRCAIAWQVELAVLARQHNNANVLALPARFIELPAAKEMVAAFLETDFEGGRHQRRVAKISCGG